MTVGFACCEAWHKPSWYVADKKTDVAATILRMLYIKDLRSLQTIVDETLVNVQVICSSYATLCNSEVYFHSQAVNYTCHVFAAELHSKPKDRCCSRSHWSMTLKKKWRRPFFVPLFLAIQQRNSCWCGP